MVHMHEIDEEAPTRHSLLARLKDHKDDDSWRDFFNTYWRLIYNTALKAGLTDAEAQDAVQETVLSVARKLSASRYDRSKGPFKPWLLKLTRWRIVDQFRKRQRGIFHSRRDPRTSTQTATVERVPDTAGFEAMWDDEWESNLLDAAIERARKRVDAKLYQMFDLYYFKDWPVSKVAATLKVSAASVYVARHKVGRLIKRELAGLQRVPF